MQSSLRHAVSSGTVSRKLKQRLSITSIHKRYILVFLMHCDSFGFGAHGESFIYFVLQIAHNGTLREIESLYNKN